MLFCLVSPSDAPCDSPQNTIPEHKLRCCSEGTSHSFERTLAAGLLYVKIYIDNVFPPWQSRGVSKQIIRKSKCRWKYDEWHSCYDTGCGQAYWLEEGSPATKTYKFCPGCGGQIEVRPPNSNTANEKGQR